MNPLTISIVVNQQRQSNGNPYCVWHVLQIQVWSLENWEIQRFQWLWILYHMHLQNEWTWARLCERQNSIIQMQVSKYDHLCRHGYPFWGYVCYVQEICAIWMYKMLWPRICHYTGIWGLFKLQRVWRYSLYCLQWKWSHIRSNTRWKLFSYDLSWMHKWLRCAMWKLWRSENYGQRNDDQRMFILYSTAGPANNLKPSKKTVRSRPSMTTISL